MPSLISDAMRWILFSVGGLRPALSYNNKSNAYGIIYKIQRLKAYSVIYKIHCRKAPVLFNFL